jgi:hypothetical protein
MVEAHLDLVVLLPQVAIFFGKMPAGFFKVVDGDFDSFKLLLQRVNLLVLLHGELLQDGHFLLVLLRLLQTAISLQVVEVDLRRRDVLLDPFASELNKLLDGLFDLPVFELERDRPAVVI